MIRDDGQISVLFVLGDEFQLSQSQHGHQMVRIGYDLFVIGGYSPSPGYKEYAMKLRCSHRKCFWQDLYEIRLLEPRLYSVAVTIPDDFLTC